MVYRTGGLRARLFISIVFRAAVGNKKSVQSMHMRFVIQAKTLTAELEQTCMSKNNIVTHAIFT